MTTSPTQNPTTRSLEDAVDYLSAVIEEMKRHAQTKEGSGYKATASEIAQVQSIVDDLTSVILARTSAAAAGSIDRNTLKHGSTSSAPSTPNYPTSDVHGIIQRAFRESSDVVPNGEIV